MEIYVVKPNDTIDKVAALYGFTTDALAYVNQIPYPYRLAIGQALLIPINESPPIRKSITAMGFAYPYISEYVLKESLPYFSDLAIFSYRFNAGGDLIAPVLDDNFMITISEEINVAPILTLTPLGEDGNFDNYLISQVVNDEESKRNLIDQLINTIITKDFQGVNIDFEYIRSTDRVAFAEFVAEVREAVNKLGYQVSVALAPKISDDMKGILYEGKDYELLGEAANSTLLMTYEWGYTFGPAMAVAPINKVREVLDYAVTKIERDKILLGIPNYGYDWTLPFVQGESKARTINNVQAVQIAIANNVEIQFDNYSMSPFFHYWYNGAKHEVWFEDVRSLKAKYALVKEYNLKGIGVWQIMQLFRAGLLLLSDTFWISKE